MECSERVFSENPFPPSCWIYRYWSGNRAGRLWDYKPRSSSHLKTFNLFALGIIGFLVGGELKVDTFKKYARQFTAILLGEGLLAFLLVGGATFFLLKMVTGNLTAALAGAVVLGAIASATDPASTIDVIWEYRSKGVMTTAIIAIVALDDALAMTLYGLGNSTAKLITSDSGRFGFPWDI